MTDLSNQKSFKRVVFFETDGRGTFIQQVLTPHIDCIFKRGTIKNYTLAELPSANAECWEAMIHDVGCYRNKPTNMAVDQIPYSTIFLV